MSLSTKTLVSIQQAYKNMTKSNTDIQNSNISVAKKKKDDEKSDSSGPKTYILEGGIIKVYVIDENGVKKCIKEIPLVAAPLSILLQTKAASLSDAIMLQDAIEGKLEGDSSTSNYNSSGDTPEFSDN